MPTLDISLPDSVKAVVDEQIASGRFGSPSEYVQNLILEDEQRRVGEDELEGLLLDGLRSGPASEFTRNDWDDIRRQGLERLRANKGSGKS